jgi:hypothetical protein
MKPPILAVALLLAAQAAQIQDGQTTVAVRKDGCGFIDAATFGGRALVKALPGFQGAAVRLAPAGDGTAASLFRRGIAATLRPELAAIEARGRDITVSGHYAHGSIRLPFTRCLTLEGDTLSVTDETDFTGLDPRYAVASATLELPLVLAEDPHDRMFAFGGARRDELFRMDMNDILRGGKQLISAPRGHWPFWDIGGVLQLPGSYRIWRANHADTMAYPMEEGVGAPGWADTSQPDAGITVTIAEPAAAAPWAIRIDARKGVLSIASHPPCQMPRAGKALGKRVLSFRLAFHATSWPVARACELPFPRYEELLRDIIQGRRPQPYVLHSPFGTADIPTLIHRERIQPSAVLRTLYRGDAWRMQGRLKAIGVSVPRNQPMAKWEQDAKVYLDAIRASGLPQRTR